MRFSVFVLEQIKIIKQIKIYYVGAMIHRPIVSEANNNGSAVVYLNLFINACGICTIVRGRWVNAPTQYHLICADKLLLKLNADFLE